MRRPSAARQTLGFSPLVDACWAHASSIERVPFMPAGAEPFVFLAWRPAAEGAADVRFGRACALVFLKLAVWNDDWIVRDWTHARYYDL